MAIYMKLGTVLKGGVTADGYATWVECGSMQFGVGKAVSTPVGNAADRDCSVASVSEITLTKDLDPSTIALFKLAVAGSDKAAKLEIHLVKNDGKKIVPFIQYEFENSLVSGYSVSSGGDRPTESLSFNFTKIQMKYVGSDAAAGEGSPVIAGFDIAKGVPS